MKIIGAIGLGLSRFLAFIFALLFVVVTTLALFAFNADRILFDAGTYKRALIREDFYARLPVLAASQAVTQARYDPCRDNPAGVENPEVCQNPSAQPEQGGPPPFMKNITQPQLEHIIGVLLPPDLLQTMVDSALDQVFAYLNSPDGTLRVNLSLADLKQRIAGNQGVEAVLTLIDSLPPCTAEQRAAGGGEFAGGMPQCRLPDADLEKMKPAIQQQLQQVVKGIPDVVSPGAGVGFSGAPGLAGGASPREIYRWLRLGLGFSPLGSIVLLGLVTFFGVRSLKGWLRWWGWPFLFVALLVVPVAVLAVPALRWAYVNRAVSQVPPYYSLEFVQAAFNVALEIVRSVLRPVLFQTLLLGGVGLALLVGSRFADRIERPPK